MKFLLIAFLSLFSASAFGEVIITAITAKPPVSVHLTGKEGDALFNQFNLLKWDGTAGARCHQPAYQIQVIEGGTTELDATICFNCRNVLFKIPSTYELRGFSAKDASAQTLRDSLGALFAAAPSPAK